MSETNTRFHNIIWLLIILVLVVFAGSVLYFSRKNPSLITNGQASSYRPVGSRQPRTYTIYYGLGIFSPTNIRIHVGDSVRFQNDSKDPIWVVSDSVNGIPDLPSFDSISDIQPQEVFVFTFNQAGIFGYNNAHNPTEEGTVIVRP